jgi:predicted dehydrogenase
MRNETLGVAIHGAGWVAAAHAASWKKNSNAEIISVSSRRKQSAQRLVDEMGLACTVHDSYDDVLKDDRVDIVNISGPNHVHAEQGMAAAEAGKHLLMEKPMALSTEQNRSLRDAVAKAGVKSVVSFVLRWNPLFDNLKALVKSGAIGKLFYTEVDYRHGIGPWYTGWDWVRTKESGRSTMLSAGCHAVDALRWFTNDEVAEVSAFANNARGLFEYDCNAVAILKFRGGTIGKCAALFDCQMPYAFNIDLLGTEGTLRENRIWSKKLFPGQTDWATVPTIMPDSGDVEHHPFDGQVNHLVDCIVEDRESHCNIADAYHTHEVCLAIDRSIAEGGRPVKLKLE